MRLGLSTDSMHGIVEKVEVVAGAGKVYIIKNIDFVERRTQNGKRPTTTNGGELEKLFIEYLLHFFRLTSSESCLKGRPKRDACSWRRCAYCEKVLIGVMFGKQPAFNYAPEGDCPGLRRGAEMSKF